MTGDRLQVKWEFLPLRHRKYGSLRSLIAFAPFAPFEPFAFRAGWVAGGQKMGDWQWGMGRSCRIAIFPSRCLRPAALAAFAALHNFGLADSSYRP